MPDPPPAGSHNQPARVLTIGHSNRSIEEFIGLLKANGANMVVDVRKMPGSRANPQFNADALEASLREAGVGYIHAPGLGGLRRRAKNPDSPNAGWRNESFRAYADYMQTPEFEKALNEMARQTASAVPALMCAEAVPWRCHRSLIADALVVRGVEVEDVISGAKPKRHALKPWAKVEGTRITYPPEDEEPDAQKTPRESALSGKSPEKS